MTLISQFATCIISLSFFKIYSLEYLPWPKVWMQNSIFKLIVSKSFDAINIAEIAVSCKSFFYKFIVFE
jgi:hypothetical protein